ncbi:MAG: hypothetical protein ACK4L7_01300, partial [Flavobacteriales bacterium]
QVLVGGYGFLPEAGDVMAVARLNGPFAGAEETSSGVHRAVAFPNPAGSEVLIDAGPATGAVRSVVLIDAGGRVVAGHQPLMRQDGAGRGITLLLDAVPAGCYTAVVLGEAAIVHAPFVKL